MNVSTRWRNHVHESRRQPAMRIDKAIAEHGPDAFQVFQLATVCSREEKFRVEDEYQRLYNSRDPEIGYNEAIPYSASRLSNFPLLGDGVR